MDFSSILSHPKSNEIFSKLLDDTIEIEEIVAWLKYEYPEESEAHLRLNVNILTKFKKSQYLNYRDQFNSDLSKIKSGEPLSKIDKKISAALLNNKTYQERLAEYAGTEIDVKQKLIEWEMFIKTRMEQIFDSIQEDPSNMGNKGDYKLLKYFEQYMKILETYDKSVNNRPDQIIQHNYTLEYIDQRAAIIQDTIKETLDELGTDATLIFMNKLNEKMAAIEFKETKKTAFPKAIEGNFSDYDDDE